MPKPDGRTVDPYQPEVPNFKRDKLGDTSIFIKAPKAPENGGFERDFKINKGGSSDYKD